MKDETKPSGARRRHGRVLVVDDEPALGRALHTVLSDENEVVVTTSASAALVRLLAGEWYDVVLCDVRMPDMDGVEFHRRLSATLPEEAHRIVFITGGGLTAHATAFFEHAPNLLLQKPLDLEGLRALIARRVLGGVESGRSTG
jgi:CheY-like chemotaxis protein